MADKASPFQARMNAAKADAIMRYTGGGGTTKPQIKSEPEINTESNVNSTPIPATIRIKKEKVVDAAVSLLDLPAADELEPEPSVQKKNLYAGLIASRKRKHAPSSPTQVEEDFLFSQEDEHKISLPTPRIKRRNVSMGIDAAVSLLDLPAADELEPGPSMPSKKPYAGLIASRKRKRPNEASSSPTQVDEDLLSSQDDDEHVISLPTRRIKRRNVSKGIDATGPSSSQQSKAQSQPRPFAPAKKIPLKKSTTPLTTQLVATRTTNKTGDWYDSIDINQSFSRSDLGTLQFIFKLIQNCETGARIGEHLEPLFQKVRKRIHDMETYDFVSGVLLRKSKVLEDKGLDAIIEDGTVGYPCDIRSDALGLYRKWRNGVLDPHLLRGIVTKKGKNVQGNSFTSRSFEAGYPHRKSCNYTGEGNLVNGQWWPLQICAMRDGAHGELEGGIHGQPGKWAYSIVLGGGGYSDVDEGNMVKYCGTSGAGGQASAGTTMLKKAHEEGKDVRVVRSATLAKGNVYRPAKGLRYDGVYKITGYEVLDAGSAMHRFTLRRRSHQDPIRCSGVAARPTEQQLSENSKIRGLTGLSN